MNSVQELKNMNFNNLSVEEKLKIRNTGRPQPLINLVQTSKCNGKDINRKFNPEVYEKYEWLCGCEITNRLYCFPCLMFASEKDGTWTNNGCGDVGHLKQKITKHELSKAHKNAQLELSVLGKYDIRQQLNSAFRRNIHHQNAEITKNRYILSQIINCVKFCGAFEHMMRQTLQLILAFFGG